MFDISWGEMLVVGVVALVVIGPKELPGVIRSLGRGLGKLRSMAGEFRTQFDEAMREADIQDVARTFTDIREGASGLSTATFDPIRNEIENVAQAAKAATPDWSSPALAKPEDVPALPEPALSAPDPAPARKPRKRSAKPKDAKPDDNSGEAA